MLSGVITLPGDTGFAAAVAGAVEHATERWGDPGSWLWLLHDDCAPEPDCLEAMLSELDRTGAPGVRGRSIPEVSGPLGELERQMFQDALEVEKEPDHWRKVLIHSFAVRRDLFLEVGGLPAHYGEYAPWPLAMAIHARGARLVYSPRPAVRHVYDGDLEDLASHVREWGCRFVVPLPEVAAYS